MSGLITSDKVCRYQVSLKSEGVRPFFVITRPGITQIAIYYLRNTAFSLHGIGASS